MSYGPIWNENTFIKALEDTEIDTKLPYEIEKNKRERGYYITQIMNDESNNSGLT